MPSPFQGCRDRVERAKAHRKALGELWENWLKKDPYAVVTDVQSDGTGTICVGPTDELPRSCPLELGETLYHLRAALDGAVYAAAIVQSGQDPPPDHDRLEFPICTSSRKFDKAARKIAPLSQQCRRFIESIQPYKTPELAPELRVLNVNRTLGILGDWSRKDRHRQLHVVGSWAADLSPQFRVPAPATISDVICTNTFLEDKTEIIRFRINGYVPSMKVATNPGLAIDIAVDEIPKPCANNDTLGQRLTEMIAVTAATIQMLEKLVTEKE